MPGLALSVPCFLLCASLHFFGEQKVVQFLFLIPGRAMGIQHTYSIYMAYVGHNASFSLHKIQIQPILPPQYKKICGVMPVKIVLTYADDTALYLKINKRQKITSIIYPSLMILRFYLACLVAWFTNKNTAQNLDIQFYPEFSLRDQIIYGAFSSSCCKEHFQN